MFINEPHGTLLRVELSFDHNLDKAFSIDIKKSRILLNEDIFDEIKNKIPVAYISMKQAKENYDLSLGRYEAGVGNPTELNDAQIDYNNAQLTYYKILYEYNSAFAALEKSIGRNLSNLKNEVKLQNRG